MSNLIISSKPLMTVAKTIQSIANGYITEQESPFYPMASACVGVVLQVKTSKPEYEGLDNNSPELAYAIYSEFLEANVKAYEERYGEDLSAYIAEEKQKFSSPDIVNKIRPMPESAVGVERFNGMLSAFNYNIERESNEDLYFAVDVLKKRTIETAVRLQKGYSNDVVSKEDFGRDIKNLMYYGDQIFGHYNYMSEKVSGLGFFARDKSGSASVIYGEDFLATLVMQSDDERKTIKLPRESRNVDAKLFQLTDISSERILNSSALSENHKAALNVSLYLKTLVAKVINNRDVSFQGFDGEELGGDERKALSAKMVRFYEDIDQRFIEARPEHYKGYAYACGAEDEKSIERSI